MNELITSLGLAGGAAWSAKKLFGPALDAMGEDLVVAYKGFRLANLKAIFSKAEKRLAVRKDTPMQPLKPRLLASLIENASLEDDDKIQDLWAAVIATSSSENEADTLFLSNILTHITAREAQLFKNFCKWSTFDFSKELTERDFGDLQNPYHDLIPSLPLPIKGNAEDWQAKLTDLLWHRNFWLPARIVAATLPAQYEHSISFPIYTARHYNLHRKAYDGLVAVGLIRSVTVFAAQNDYQVTLNALELTRMGIELAYRTAENA